MSGVVVDWQTLQKEAKTLLAIAGIEGASNPNELKEAICETHCIGRCKELTCTKLESKWIPLDVVVEWRNQITKLIDEFEQRRFNFEHEWMKNRNIKMPNELDKSRANYAEGYARALKHILEKLKGLVGEAEEKVQDK